MLKKTKQKETLTAREENYLNYIDKHPILATLMVLEDYEKSENYIECAKIRNALKVKGSFTRKDQYMDSKKFTATSLQREIKTARTKADLIKIKLPI